jgi:hypothetical protein
MKTLIPGCFQKFIISIVFPAPFERHQRPSGWWRHGAGQTRSPSAACWLPAIVPSAGKWLKACSGTCHWRRRKSFTHWEIQRCEIVLTRIFFDGLMFYVICKYIMINYIYIYITYIYIICFLFLFNYLFIYTMTEVCEFLYVSYSCLECVYCFVLPSSLLGIRRCIVPLQVTANIFSHCSLLTSYVKAGAPVSSWYIMGNNSEFTEDLLGIYSGMEWEDCKRTIDESIGDFN